MLCISSFTGGSVVIPALVLASRQTGASDKWSCSQSRRMKDPPLLYKLFLLLEVVQLQNREFLCLGYKKTWQLEFVISTTVFLLESFVKLTYDCVFFSLLEFLGRKCVCVWSVLVWGRVTDRASLLLETTLDRVAVHGPERPEEERERKWSHNNTNSFEYVL